MSKSKWTAEKKIHIVLEPVNARISIAELSHTRSHTKRILRVEGGVYLCKVALSSLPEADANKERRAEVDELSRLIGESSMANKTSEKLEESK